MRKKSQMQKKLEQEKKETWQRDMDKLRNLAVMLGPGKDLQGIVTRRAIHLYDIEDIAVEECGCVSISLIRHGSTTWSIHHWSTLKACDFHKRSQARIIEIVDWNGL